MLCASYDVAFNFSLNKTEKSRTFSTFQLLCSTNPRHLKLSPCDDVIEAEVTKCFPHLTLDPVDEEQLKGQGIKEKWREFMNKFDKTVDDFNFGTLLRVACDGRYDSENTILGSLFFSARF